MRFEFAAMPLATMSPTLQRSMRMQWRSLAIRVPIVMAAFVIAAMLASGGCTTGKGVTGGDSALRRATSDAMAAGALEDLYRYNPSARGLVETAAGYAAFDASRAAVEPPATAQAPGVLVDNATKQRTYLTMMRPSAGYGVGYGAFRRVIVFAGKDALDRFRASSTAGAGTAGAPESTIVIFDLTVSGVVAVANWGTTQFVVDGSR